MSLSNNVVIDEKLLDSYRDLIKNVKDVKAELIKSTDEIEVLLNKLCHGIVRQELQQELNKTIEESKHTSIEELSAEMLVNLPQDFEAKLQEMKTLRLHAENLIRKVEASFKNENI